MIFADSADPAYEPEQQESVCDTTSFITEDQDDTNCLANVIGDAIRDGYDLREEHAGELSMFKFPQGQQGHGVEMLYNEEGGSPGRAGGETESCNIIESSFAETEPEKFGVEMLYNEEGGSPGRAGGETESCNTVESSLAETEPEKFGFEKYICPQLVTRHPPPATGRDDDPDKLQEILDDLLLKMGHQDISDHEEKILFGPDHKIGKNLLSLRNHGPKYEIFLPEFPLLHVRKHKITILFSAYKDAGLVQLLRYMRDDEEDDWRKLVSAVHIETATRHIRRALSDFPHCLSNYIHKEFTNRSKGTDIGSP